MTDDSSMPPEVGAALALAGLPPEARRLLLASASPGVAALAASDPLEAAAALLHGPEGRLILAGLAEPPPVAPDAAEPPDGLSLSARMTWARENRRT
jgi:hypothetical protein